MLKGYWPYHTPMGYENLKPKHKACEHEYIITKEGKLIKQAFLWKAEGVMNDKKIIDKLSIRGLRITEKNFRWIMSNVFYTGYITGKLLNGQLVKGKHPSLIDLKTFLKANELLQNAPNVGITKHHKRNELPLKLFAKEEISGSPLTGYIKKGIWYYKARKKGVGVNVSANKLNTLFQAHLKQFEYKKQYTSKLSKAIEEGLKKRLTTAIEETITLKKRISELNSQKEKLEERYVMENLEKDLYAKFISRINIELGKLNSELSRNAIDSSNLKKAVEKVLQIAENISILWASGDFDEKQKLQKLVFPDGIMYNKKNHAVRTQRINILFAEIPYQASLLEENINGNSEGNRHLSSSVPRTGIEPAHPCERQILSLLRLPIPPSGLY